MAHEATEHALQVLKLVRDARQPLALRLVFVLGYCPRRGSGREFLLHHIALFTMSCVYVQAKPLHVRVRE